MDAVSELYRDYQTRDHPTRIAAYDSAMQRLAAANPGDREARIFAALASVQTAAPTDKTYAKQLAAGAILEELFAAYPDHPGLAHYIIHAYDVPALAPRALDAARRYATIAPSAPHALHMPSHTFTRLGYWQESIQSNIASAASAAAESATAEQLHAMDYMAYAYLQLGRDDEVRALIAQVAGLQERLKSPAAGGSAAPVAVGTYATAAIPARYALERADWAGATALTVPAGATPQSEAVTEFARAVGAARSGHPAAASSSLDRLAAIRDALRTSGDAYWSGQSEIQRQGASAWVAWARGEKDEGLRLAAAAADAEDATEKSAATPGPLMPARELLADMQFEAGRFADAQRSYEAVLTKEPHRFRAEYGAGLAAERAGDTSAAHAHYRALVAQCAPVTGSPRDALTQAQRALEHATLESRKGRRVSRVAKAVAGQKASGIRAGDLCDLADLSTFRPPSVQIFRDRRSEELLRLGLGEIVFRDHPHAGVDPLVHRLALQVGDHRLHAQISHVEGILHDDALHLARAEGVDERLTGIEADERDLASLVDVLQREQHARGGRLVDAEDALQVAGEPIEQVLRCAFRRITRRTGVLL